MSLSVSQTVDDGASTWTCNFLVMSDAGKPIFARYGSEEEIAKICGLLQAIRSSVGADASLGDIRSLRSSEICLVFMTVNFITLVAIGKATDSQAFLKLQLEYMFGQIIFAVTEAVQAHFEINPSFDLRSMLGNTHTIINGILNESDPGGSPGPFLIGGIQSAFPISPAVRARTSSILQVVGLKTDLTIFAILSIGDKVLSMIQPSFPVHQMRVSDLRLLLKFVSRQQGLLSSELWIPVCLPRFSSQDFLFCYTQCLDPSSNLCLILISQQSTTYQFELFRTAASTIRNSLELPPLSESVLEIIEPSESAAMATPLNDVKWRRNDYDMFRDQAYVDAAGDGDTMIPYVPRNFNEHPLLQEARRASESDTLKRILDEYLDIGSALHFVFRMDVPLRLGLRSDKAGKFPQCISSYLGFPFIDDSAKRRVWINYQKLSLRLRLASASPESMMDAFDMISQDNVETKNGSAMASGISQYCPAIALVESPAHVVDGIAYILDGSELFLAMNGSDFDLLVFSDAVM
jgi:hypothetical protein